MSQRALAFPGCSPAYISRLEAGDRIPSLQLIRELGKRLGVSEAHLLGEEAGGAGATQLIDAEIALRLDAVAEARRLYSEILESPQTRQEEVDALAGLARIALRDGRTEDAIGQFERALEMAGGDPAEVPSLAESLGRAYAQAGQFGAAIGLFRRCVARYESDADPIQHIRFACLLGYALTDNGDLAEAERVLATALERGWGIADPYTRARLYWSQSRLLGEQSKSDQSARYARMALETLKMTEDTYSIALAHQLLAHAYLDGGRAEEALEVLREARPMIAVTATPTDLAYFEIEEARAVAAMGEAEEAGAIALSAAGRLNDARPIDAGRAYLLLADVYATLGDAERHRELLELAIEAIEVQPNNRYLIDAYRKLGTLLEEQGRTQEALAAFKQALAVQERVGRVST